MKHLLYYTTHAKLGIIDWGGLCAAATRDSIDSETLRLFTPTEEDEENLIKDKMLLEHARAGYWGAGVAYGHPDRNNGFTPLRQTIVLFMAAINNEL